VFHDQLVQIDICVIAAIYSRLFAIYGCNDVNNVGLAMKRSTLFGLNCNSGDGAYQWSIDFNIGFDRDQMFSVWGISMK